MSAVLMDNWNLVRARLIKDRRGNYVPNDAYSDILSALVLWDDVFYLDDGFATFGWMCDKREIKGLLNPLYIDIEVRRKIVENANLLYSNKYIQKYTRTVAQRAIYYSEISKFSQLNYLPVKKRVEFLDEFMDTLYLCTRSKIIDAEEREIKSYIQQFNGSSISDIAFPLLSNLIIKSSYSSDNYFKTALSIKKTREVKTFRRYMDKIDRELNNGNTTELKYVLNLIPEIVNEIQNMDKRIKLTASVKMKISPMAISMITGSILSGIYSENKLLSMGLFCGTLGELFKDSYFEIKKEWGKTCYPKRIQITFLRNLAKNVLL